MNTSCFLVSPKIPCVVCTSSAMRVYLLILLSSALSLGGATEYYVRPTEPTNTSCPAQPCLTLNQYTNDSDHYFKSNTVFKFLPGTHHMHRPVSIGNVHNVSLEKVSDEHPHLVAQFSCESYDDCIIIIDDYCLSCAAFWMHDMYNVTLKGISVTIERQGVSGVIFQNVSRLNVQLATGYSLMDYECFGIAIYEASSVEVYSSTTNSCSHGLVVYYTTDINIMNVMARRNKVGIALQYTTDSFITNTTAEDNTHSGIRLYLIRNTHITNTTASHNGQYGLMSIWSTNNTHITNTRANHNGDNGMFLQDMTNTHIINVTTTHNGEEGLLFYNMINTYITTVTASHNGVARQYYETLTFQGEVTVQSSVYTLIYNTSFVDVSASVAATGADPSKLPVIIALYQSSLYVSRCYFSRNSISAIKAWASNITVSGDLTFSDNRGFDGTVFIFIRSSVLSFEDNSHVYFINNYATNTGGVFYILTDVYIDDINEIRSNCFINTQGIEDRMRFTFVNNSAGKGGDILYGGDIALGLNGIWNCLDSFKRMSNISQNGLSLISSDPSRACLCNETGQPDCVTIVDPTLHFIYPGQTIRISVVVVGQDFGTASGSVFAQFLPPHSKELPPHMESWQQVQAVKQYNCNDLHYTVSLHSKVSEAVLALTAHNIPVPYFLNGAYEDEIQSLKNAYGMSDSAVKLLRYSSNPVYVNISALPCPSGFMLTTNPPFICICSQLLQQISGVQCHIQDQTIGRRGLVWVGIIQDGNTSQEVVTVSKYCSLDYCKSEDINVTLIEPDTQCNYNHSGILCGGCQPGFSLALGSAQCLQCSNEYLALLIPFTLAGPVLVVFIKVLDFTIAQGTLNGLIFYANVVKANEYIFLPRGQTHVLNVFIAWLNLDLGVETCFFQGLSAYTKTWLQFVFPFYIWIITWLIIGLAKYCNVVAKVMGNSSVAVLATLFLLSYAKLFRTIITALSYTMLHSSQGHRAVWTADGNVDYLSPKHTPLFAIALAALLFLWLPYTLLLFLGQWLHMCNGRFISYILIKIKPFLDAHYGPMKGEHRYWFGALLLVRATILLISALVPANRASIVVYSVLISAAVLMYFGRIVYQNITVSMFDTFFFLNLVLLAGSNLFISTEGGEQIAAAYTLIGMTFVQFIGLVLFKVFTILKQSEKVKVCLHKRQQHSEDDWELYEEAALLREVESDEEQDNEDTGSIESLPTY